MLNLPQLLYPAYERRLLREIDGKKRPGHVAIMCDGNRRWARESGFTDVSHGYRLGAKKIGELVRWCDEVDVNLVTVYLLSTENLDRQNDELQLLFDIIGDVVDELARPTTNCRLRLVGHLDLLPEAVKSRLRDAEITTVNNSGVAVNVAVGYGGRQEIVDAVRTLLVKKMDEGLTGQELVNSVTVDSVSTHLYTSGQPDPDLVIRTSGEQRLSGFMLWQSAYSEIWFTDTYWPAFRKIDFLRALRDYSQRNRRFGK